MIVSTCDILVKGGNFELLIKRLKRRGVDLLDFKILNKNEVIIKVKRAHAQKVFEISENMWYNIIVAEHGAAKLFSTIKSKLALIVAAILFFGATYYLSGSVLGLDLTAVGKGYRSRVERVLKDNGVKVFSRFSGIKKDGLEKELLKIENVGFVSVEKCGVRLKVTLTPTDEKSGIAGLENVIKTNVSGVVEDITVYRGRALVKVGDFVAAGDVLVDGQVDFDEERSYQTYCSARVVVRSTVVEEISSPDSGDSAVDRAVAIARLSVFGEEVSSKVEITPAGESFVIKVTLDLIVLYGA